MMQIKGKWLWISQRVTAGLLLVDAVLNAVWWGLHPDLTHRGIQAYLSVPWLAVLNILLVIGLVLHSAVGLWAIRTDYLLPAHMGRMALPLRIFWDLGTILVLGLVLGWSVWIFGGFFIA